MADEKQNGESKHSAEKPSGGGSKKARTGRKHESKSPKDYYEIQSNSVARKRKTCPRCGDGTFMAKHKDRLYCGRCGYTVFEGKNSGKPTEKTTEGSKQNQTEEKPDSE